MNTEKQIIKPKIILTDAEKKLKRTEYGIQWRLKNVESIKTYRKDNASKLATLQRKYDNAKRKDPEYIALHKARQKRCRDKKKELKRLLKVDKANAVVEEL